MHEIIIINPETNKCIFIQNDDGMSKLNEGTLYELVNKCKNKEDLVFIISKYSSIKDTIQVPRKNKSIFLKNVQNIIKQNYSDQNIQVFTQKQINDELPYIVISNKEFKELENVKSKFDLKNNFVLLEKDLYNTKSNSWHISYIKDEIFIYYNSNVLQTSKKSIENDIHILLQNKYSPEIIKWTYLQEDEESIKDINNLKSLVNKLVKCDQSVENIFETIDFTIANNSYLQKIDDIYNYHNKIDFSYITNWKPYNLVLISSMIFTALFLQYSNASKFNSQLELRHTNILSSVFRDLESNNFSSDLNAVASKINLIQHLPEKNYILIFNLIGGIFENPEIKLKKIVCNKDEITMILIATNDKSVNYINQALQKNKVFSSKINSIQNQDDKEIQINLSLTYEDA